MSGVKNINVKYNLDTQEVKVGTEVVTQAKLATDNLTASVQKFNTQAGQGFKATGVVVGDLRGELAALQAKIEQTDIADKSRLATLQAQYRQIKEEVNDYNKALQDTQKNTQAIGTSLSALGNTVRAVITAGILREVISVNLEMAKLAGQVDGVKRAFDKLPNSTILFQELRAATHGTIDDLTLMQKAVQAQNFKIPLEQLATLLEFASIKAQQTGLDIDYLTNSLITGLGRNSIRLLDNLQISVTELREKTKELGSQQKAVFFLVNEQMKTMGGYVENSATKVDQLTASWKNLKIAASQTLASSGFVGFLDKIVEGYTAMFKGQKQLDDEFNQGIAIKYAKEFLTVENSNTEAIDKQITKLKEEMQTRGALKATIKEQMAATNNEGFLNLSPIEQTRAKNMLVTLAQQNDITQKEIAILKQKQLQLDATNIPQKEQLGLIEALDEKIKQLNEDLVKTTSRKNIIEIQVQIKQAEAEKADLLDPDRMARQAKEAFDKTNDEIRTGIRSNSETIIKESAKGAKGIEDNSLFKQLNKSMAVEIKQFVAGLRKGMKEASDEEKKAKADFDKFLIASSRYAKEIANAIVTGDAQKYDSMISNLQDYYSEQEALAGTNTKRIQQLQKEEKSKEDQLRKEQKAAQKRDAILRIEIDTAANIIKSIAQLGVPWGLVLGAEAAALGAIQISNVNKFAKGVIDLKGPGTETSDSIPSLLSKGESVMTAQETHESGNILRSIRAKKLNDQVLEKLTVTTDGVMAKMDLEPLISEYRKTKSPDYARQFSDLYETKEVRKGMKKIIRSKSFNN